MRDVDLTQLSRISLIQTEGTPVPKVGLDDPDVDVPKVADELLRRYDDEAQDIWLARCKVRVVSE